MIEKSGKLIKECSSLKDVSRFISFPTEFSYEIQAAVLNDTKMENDWEVRLNRR